MRTCVLASNTSRQHSTYLKHTRTLMNGSRTTTAIRNTASLTAASLFGGTTTRQCGTSQDLGKTTNQLPQGGILINITINPPFNHYGVINAINTINLRSHGTARSKKTSLKQQRFKDKCHYITTTPNHTRTWTISTVGTFTMAT